MNEEKKFYIESVNIETPLPNDIADKRKEEESNFSLKEYDKRIRPDKKKIYNLVNNDERGIAKKNVLTWLGENPNDIGTIEILIFIEKELGNKDEVEYWCNIINHKNPKNKFVEYINKYYESNSEMIKALKEKRMEECVSLGKIILEDDENDKSALISISRAYKGLRDYKKSIKYWDRLLKLNKLNEEELLEYCNTLYNAREFKKIIRIISFRNDNSLSSNYLELYIRSLFNLRQFDYCIRICEKLLDKEKGNKIALRFLSKSLISSGKIIMASEILEEWLSVEGPSVEIYENLIETYLRMDKREKVESVWSNLEKMGNENITNFLIAVEITMKFNWKERYNILLKNKELIIGDKNYNIELSRIALDNGNISESYKYLKLSERNNDYQQILDRINYILETTNANLEEIEIVDGNIPIDWISSLAIRELLRKQKKKNELRIRNIKYSLVTSTLNRGGAERQVALTAKGISERGLDCNLAIHRKDEQNDSTYQEDLKMMKNKIRILSEINLDEESNSGYQTIQENRNLLNLLNNTTNEKVKRLVSYFSDIKPDLVHAWQDETILTSAIACGLTGIPHLVGSARSLRPDRKTELHIRKKPYLKESLKIIMENDWFHLTINSEAGKTSYSEWLEIDETDIKVIHNGTDFKSMEANTRIGAIKSEIGDLGMEKENIIIGGVFRLEAGKRPRLWIEVLERLIMENGNIRGLIIGGGKMEKTVKKWVRDKDLQDKIKILGERKDVAGWLSEIDIFLLTSISEGLPNAIIEAQGFGVPVVSTDVGGVAEIIIDGVTGKLTKSEESESISKVILDIINNKEYENMIAPSRKNTREKFSLESMLDKTERMYNEVISTIN